MAKAKKKPTTNTGNHIQIEFQRRLDDEYVITDYLELRSTTGVSPFGDNPNFEWEGTYSGKLIRVSLPRSTHERNAVIEGSLPNGYDPARGSVENQLYSEISRILRQIN